jgi:hypothetical protein
MNHSRNHSLFTILLAVLVTTGLGLAAVQANAMGVKMAITADMDNSGSKGCSICPDDGNDSTAACSIPCLATASATLPAALIAEPSTLTEQFVVLHSFPRDGPRTSEPYPPKS